MLYDAPVSTGYKVLTHANAGRKYAKNGYGQVGNTVIPTNEISQNRVTRSSIYNQGITVPGNTSLKYYGGGSKGASGSSGLSEAGYGRRYPNPKGLSDPGRYRPGLRYSGAGSYGAAGSNGLKYYGAGSKGASGSNGLKYYGGGSYGAAGSRLRDAYINDNPPPGTLRGLSDDEVPVDSGSAYGPALPPVDTSGGFFSSITNAFSNLLSTTAKTAVQEGTLVANSAVANAINPPQTAAQKIVTTLTGVTNPKTVMGISVDTFLLVGAGVGIYYFLKK